MSGKAILDSNAVIRVLNGSLILPQLGFDEILVPLIAVGELFYGVHKSARVTANRLRLMAFVSSVELLPVDLLVAEQYGIVKSQLRSKGKPIPENDIWTAAITLRHRLPLVSDDGHFDVVEGLSVVKTRLQ